MHENSGRERVRVFVCVRKRETEREIETERERECMRVAQPTTKRSKQFKSQRKI